MMTKNKIKKFREIGLDERDWFPLEFALMRRPMEA
jgi:hypothetical protein